MRVTEVHPSSDPRWDAFVAAHPDGVVYQHSAWLNCLEAEYGRRAVGLCCEDDQGELRGVLPLVATRGVPGLRGNELFGARVSSLPRTPVAGPLARDEDAARALLDAAVERPEVRGGARLQLKRRGADLEGLSDRIGGAEWRPSYVVELPEEGGDVRFGNSRNHSRIKWAVNKARKEGVEVREAESLDDVAAWYRLYLETMREVVVPPRPLRLFQAMWRELVPRGLMWLHLAEQRDPGGGSRSLAGGSIVLGLGRTAFYAFNGRRRSMLALRPNEVIQWEAIHAAAARGFRQYDLGEVAEGNQGLVEFKRKWGGEEVTLHRYYHPPPEPAPQTAEASPGRPRQLAARVWPRLPLGVTRAAGDLAYRWL